MKVTLEMTEEQARALVAACDLAYRVASGDWRDIAHYAAANNTDHLPDTGHFGPVGNILAAASRFALKLPARNENAHYGIGAKELHADIARLHVVGHTVRHALAWHRHPEGGITVDFNRPMSFQPAGEAMPIAEVKP